MAMLSEVGARLKRLGTTAQEELWMRAVPEQQRLTVQLCRNSFYFLTSYILIRFFGDQLAL